MSQTQSIVPVNEVGNESRENVPALSPPRLPYHPAVQERFGVDRAGWKALVEAIFPNAQTVESVILALSYCRARKLDPFKRNVHIVPIWNRDKQCLVDTIWPGIGELRTTAFRTGEYAGRSEAVFGPTITKKVGRLDVTYPEWCQVTVFRIVKGDKREFAGPKVHWLETYATYKRDDDSPNEMWHSRPFGQIEKCAEAAALRAGFPEEIGSDYIPEEVAHTRTLPTLAVEQVAANGHTAASAIAALGQNTTLPQDSPPAAGPAAGDKTQGGAGSVPDTDPIKRVEAAREKAAAAPEPAKADDGFGAEMAAASEVIAAEKRGSPKFKLGDKIRQTKHDPKNVPDPGFMK